MSEDICTCMFHCTLDSNHDKGCCDKPACFCWCHGEIKLYVDDERPTPEGWFRVYNIEQAFFWLGSKRVTHLSMDNDLGGKDHTTEGYNVLDRLEEWVHYDSTFPVPIILVHSSNAGRAPSMRQTAAKLERIRRNQMGRAD